MRGMFAMCLALTAPAISNADQPYTITPFGIKGTLCVVDGKLILGLSGRLKAFSEWKVSPGWRADPTFIRPSDADEYSTWSVGYDPKTRQVVLAQGDRGEVKCAWKVAEAKQEIGQHLQAAAGKYKGWYLTVEEEEEKATDRKGNDYTFHRLILTEKPTKRSLWSIEQIGK